MSPQLRALAAQLVDSDRFSWLPGMRLVSVGEGSARVVSPTVFAVEGAIRSDKRLGCYLEAWSDDAVHPGPCDQDLPDLDDPATLGALLSLVRRDAPDAVCGRSRGRWVVMDGLGGNRIAWGSCEAGALVAALLNPAPGAAHV